MQNIFSISLDTSKGKLKKIIGRTPKRGLYTILSQKLFKSKKLFYRWSNGNSVSLMIVLFNYIQKFWIWSVIRQIGVLLIACDAIQKGSFKSCKVIANLYQKHTHSGYFVKSTLSRRKCTKGLSELSKDSLKEI